MRRSLRPARRKIGTGDIQRARRAPAPDSGKRKSWWTADATDAQKDLRRRLRNALPIEKADSGSSVCRCGTPAGWSPCRPPAVVLRHNGEPNELFNTWGWGWYAAGTISQRPRPTGDNKQTDTYHACFGTRFGGVSGGRETQGWRVSSHTAMVGAGKLGSAKLPMATVTCPGKPSFSQKTVEPHIGQK
jgi:hypothetical protein